MEDVDVGVAAESVLVPLLPLAEINARPILVGWVQIWTRKRVCDQVHRVRASDLLAPPLPSFDPTASLLPFNGPMDSRKMDLSK